jgi:hypothetical protein
MCDTPRVVVSRPRWGALYGATLPQLTALGVVEFTSPPNPLRTVLRFVLAVGAFAGMAAWVRANRAALDLQNWCECAGQTMTVRVIESRRPAPAEAIVPAPIRTPAVVEEAYEPAAR